MSDFQLILLSEVERPLRQSPIPGDFRLIDFGARAGAKMASATGAIRAEVIQGWLKPHAALAQATAAYGDEGHAKTAILECLRGGRMQAAADASAWEGFPNRWQTGPTTIGPNHWDNPASEYALKTFWQTSIIRFYHALYEGHRQVRAIFYGVKFEPGSFKVLLADAPEKSLPSEIDPASSAPSKNKGGRPSKEWWDDFWIAICWQIYEGDLKPKTQADLARAMHEWVENHPTADAGETTIKAAAKKLFMAWKLGSKT